MIWAEQVSCLILQIKLSYLRMSCLTRHSPLFSGKDSLRYHWNLILPLLLFFFYSHPLGRFQSWPVHFFLPWVFPEARISRSGRWCGAEVLGDSGTGRCCLRRQRERKKPPVFYTCGLLKFINISFLPDVSCDYNNL